MPISWFSIWLAFYNVDKMIQVLTRRSSKAKREENFGKKHEENIV